MNNQTYIIAIAGHSGAGKSTLIQSLAARLGGVITLGIDDYESGSQPRAVEWIERGANANEFQSPEFFADVQALKAGKSIIHPISKQETYAGSYVVIEEPFGRGRDALREHIDFLVYMDTPLEIAYVRKLTRKSDFLPWEDDPAVFIAHLRENMEWYLRIGRKFYMAVSEIAKRECDLIVDGARPTEQIAEEIIRAVGLKRGSATL